MIGIYCFTNKINNKKYIGQSIVLEQRYKQHIRNIKNQKFQSPLYLAFRKYGIENFDYKILEETTQELLDEREIYWISYFDSYNNGYNLTAGGQHNCVKSSKLSKEDVLNIKDMLRNSSILMEEISNEYNVSISTISMINNGKIWTDINEDKYPIMDLSVTKAKGSRVNTAIFSEKDVMLIRKRYVNESIPSIYEDYKNKSSLRAIQKICYGHTFSFLPCYVKRKKQWILNGTCIDYPSEGE